MAHVSSARRLPTRRQRHARFRRRERRLHILRKQCQVEENKNRHERLGEHAVRKAEAQVRGDEHRHVGVEREPDGEEGEPVGEVEAAGGRRAGRPGVEQPGGPVPLADFSFSPG